MSKPETPSTPSTEAPAATQTPAAGATENPATSTAAVPTTPEAPASGSGAAVGTVETKPTDAKEPEAKPALVPDKYELKLPEGSQLDAKAIERISAVAKTQKLSNDAAQALLESEDAGIAAYAESQKQQVAEKTKAWVTEIQNDKELGGDAFSHNAELASRVLNRYASESFREILSQTGLGNHPELVRIFTRIGKAMSEDQLILPGSQGGSVPIEDIFYPKQST